MTPRTLPREPWRGSMLCGWQTSYGGWSRPMEFCAERKGDGLYVCEAHWDELIEYGENIVFADGNAVGESHWVVRLPWEPDEGTDPIEASADEVALYASILTPERGE